jgi:D-tyrosyl-tRNA(Tyr) deacylase
VREASVRVGERETGAIGAGLLVLVGAERGDGPPDVAYVARRIAGMRIFDGPDGGSVDVSQASGAVLVVSQFTLLGDMRRGRRPDFARAAPRAEAEPAVDAVVRALAEAGLRVATGEFGADMQVGSINDGPYTILLDSRADRRADEPRREGDPG